MLVVVAGPGSTGSLVRQVITATARPREDLEVLGATGHGRPLIAADSPAPASLVVAGRPAAPGRGASSFQQSQYQHALTRWREEVAAGEHAVATRSKAAVAHWVGSLGLQAAVTGPAGLPGVSLPRDCSLAASTVSGLVDQAGSRFRGRAVLLSVARLSGRSYGANWTGTMSSSSPPTCRALQRQARTSWICWTRVLRSPRFSARRPRPPSSTTW